ncbi:glutamate 5-kinase [Priestia aryabhattai B8W22]|nr:glutamate 5-kinase [Priestia aryabhattai B8W22]
MYLYKNRIAIKVGTSTLTNKIELNNLKSFDQIAYGLSR